MRKLGFIVFILLFFSGAGVLRAESSSTDNTEGINGKFIIVLAEHLNLTELKNKKLDNLNLLIEEGAIGLMNTNTAGSRASENTYITLANGVRSLGTGNAGLSYNIYENVQLTKDQEPVISKNLYENATGEKVQGQIVQISVPAIIAANEELFSSIKVGALGETLTVNGKKVGVLGNSDAFSPSRLATLLVMDEKGQVAQGRVDRGLLKKDEDFPFGIRTNYAELEKEYMKLYKNLDLIVIETGDLSRIESYRSYLSEARYEALREQAFIDIDNFLGQIFTTVDWDFDRVMLLSPTPSQLALEENNTATPVILKGKGVSPGLLSSNSTRREGIVANTDIAPTVVDYWGLTQPPEMIGRAVFSVESTEGIESLSNLNERLVINSSHRTVILRSFLILQITYLLVAVALLLLIQDRKVLRYFANFSAIFLILPLLILSYWLFRLDSLLFTIPLLLLILGVGYLIFIKVQKPFYYKVAILSMVASLGVIVDTLTGSNLVMNSPLGYDPLIGARYYGIGNEYTGVLMGATIFGFAGLFQFFPNYRKTLLVLAGLYFLFVTYVLYAPGLGADAGGLITAVIAFGYFLLKLTGKKIRKKDVFILIIITLGLLFLGATIDLIMNESGGSHIGQAFRLLVAGDYEEISNIIARKVGVNLKLIMYSIWAKVIASSLLALGTLYYRPVGFMKYLEEKSGYLKIGFEAVFIAALVGFIVNDSGILQATTTFIYFTFPLVYLGLVEKERALSS